MPAPVETAESVLDDVFGSSPVPEHDDTEADKPKRVSLVQSGNGSAGIIVPGKLAGWRRFSHGFGLHIPETLAAAASCLEPGFPAQVPVGPD